MHEWRCRYSDLEREGQQEYDCCCPPSPDHPPAPIPERIQEILSWEEPEFD